MLGFALQLLVASGFRPVKDEKGAPPEAPRPVARASVVFGVVAKRTLGEGQLVVVLNFGFRVLWQGAAGGRDR
jgi:hypothetical protein